MNYEQAMDFIDQSGKFGSKLGLKNISVLMSYLSDPQNNLKFIHVAGTNGKGSACAMLSNVFIKAGYTTGLYISPYLENYNERIQLNNAPISDEDLVKVISSVKSAVDKMIENGYDHPTEFEINTAAAFLYYKIKKADIVILEVGMGGRLDATNVINQSEASVIMSIGLDHQQYLGKTKEKIAFEKAGIIKENGNVVIYPLNTDGVKNIITEQAKKKHAHSYICDENNIKILSSSTNGQLLRYDNPSSVIGTKEFELGLLGEHQAYNALTVLYTLEVMKKRGWNISDTAIEEAMQSVKFSGRFEILCRKPYIIIDGGHNIDGVKTFVNGIKTYFKNKKVTLFFGMLSDKQVDESVDLLISIAKRIYTLTPEDPRAVSAAEMRDFIKGKYPNIEVEALGDIKEISKHINLNNYDEIYAFTGSLYMIGFARTLINNIIKHHS